MSFESTINTVIRRETLEMILSRYRDAVRATALADAALSACRTPHGYPVASRLFREAQAEEREALEEAIQTLMINVEEQ